MLRTLTLVSCMALDEVVVVAQGSCTFVEPALYDEGEFIVVGSSSKYLDKQV